MPTLSPSPSPLRTLFLTEAVLKLLGGTIFLLSPGTVLKKLTSQAHHPVSESLLRNLGTQTVAFSVPLFLAARGDTASVGSRRIVYWTLLAREGCLMVGLLGQMVGLLVWGRAGEMHGVHGGDDDGDVRAVEEGLVMERRGKGEDWKVERQKLVGGLGWWVAELVPFVVARVWVLGWKGEWFGCE